MENLRLPKKVGSNNYLATTIVVFMYELIGTFILLAVINATKGGAAAVGFTYLFLLLMGGPISGGHYNPAVTIGVLLNKLMDTDRAPSLILQAFVMIVGQLIGALLGVQVFLQILKDVDANGNVINQDKFPQLVPKAGLTQGQAEALEMFVTFVFVTSVLLVKDSRAGKLTANIGSQSVSFFGCAIISLTLGGMILIGGPYTGASMNPAVSLAQTQLAYKVFGENEVYYGPFRMVYIQGPLFGAFLAGAFSWIHTAALRDHGPVVDDGDKSIEE